MAPTTSHKAIRMDLKTIKGIGPSKQDKLKAAGVTTVEALARCDVEEVAQASGLPAAQVKELKHRAAAHALLEDLKGFGPGSFATLSERSAQGVRDLYKASADWLAAEIKVAQERLAELREEAEAVARHVAEEAKTPEGRARLAEEGKAVAQSAARKAQEAGQKAVAKAKELQEKAPALIAQAQATAKDAQERLKAAVQRSEEVVRTEAQKAKARTERVVEQTKARMNRAS